MKILVTGGAGFIGSSYVRRLLDAGHELLVVDNLSLGSRELLPNHAKLTLEVLDCNDPRFGEVVRAFAPKRVVHLAANSDISAGTRDPGSDRDKTFSTTFAVLEAMRGAGVRELVFASTSAIYGDAPGDLKEDHGPLRPISLYGAGKLASEAYVSAYAHLFGMSAWIFRFPNVVGPRLTHGAIYDFVRKLVRDRNTLSVLGDGSQEKPYLHVDDLIDAIELGAARAPNELEVYNVAGEGMTSVRQIAEMVVDAMGWSGVSIRYGEGNRGWPGDVPRFCYDTSKIRSLGFAPKLSSDEAVRSAVRAEVDRCKPSS